MPSTCQAAQTKTQDPTDSPETAGLLLHRFGAADLGEGNLTVGANVLAAMALVVEGLRRPGSRVELANGTTIEPRGGCLVSGGLASAMVVDKVLSPLRAKQAAFQYHHECWRRHMMKAARNPDKETDTSSPSRLDGTPLLSELDKTDDGSGYGRFTRRAGLLVQPAERMDFESRERPIFFATVAAPGDIDRLMPFGHAGRMLVHVPINDPSGFARFGGPIVRLLDGVHLGPGHLEASGDVISTDVHAILGGAVADGTAENSWPARLPWLVETCPEARFVPAADSNVRKIGCVNAMFESAVDRVLLARLAPAAGPGQRECQFSHHWQTIWIRLLRKLEPACPGIAGALRPLLVSLMAGLYEICKDPALPNRAAGSIDPLEVLAFAGLLARRMVAFRQRHLRDMREAERKRLIMWILTILSEGPRSVRDLTRRKHRLSADTCRDALQHLLTTGAVACDGRAWILTNNHSPSHESCVQV